MSAFRKIFLCLVLQIGTMMGVAMRPEQIEELLHAMSRPKVARTNPDESGKVQKLLRKLGLRAP